MVRHFERQGVSSRRPSAGGTSRRPAETQWKPYESEDIYRSETEPSVPPVIRPAARIRRHPDVVPSELSISGCAASHQPQEWVFSTSTVAAHFPSCACYGKMECRAVVVRRHFQRAQNQWPRRDRGICERALEECVHGAHGLKRWKRCSSALGPPQISILLVLLMSLGGLHETEGWIALSKDGYVITRSLNLEDRNGTLVEGDMLVNSALSGSFNHSDVERKLATANVKEIDDVAKLRDKLTGCIPSRVGAFRWSSLKDIEGCTENGHWRPVELCDRNCGFAEPPLPTLKPPELGGALDCSASAVPVLNKTSGDWAVQENVHRCLQPVDYFPFKKLQAITGVTTLYLLNTDQVKKYDEKKTTFLDLTGLTNSLCIIKFADEELTSSSTPPILEIWTIGKRLNWDPANPLKQRIWRKSQASDQSWLKAFLAEELAKLIPALQKIETVWDDPSVRFQGVLPINRMVENRTCNDYNFSSPGFDYLRVFYNDTGWETLFPEPTTMPFNMPEIVPICSGHKIMPSPWIVYSKQKDLLSKAAGVIGSGVNSGEPVMYNIRESGVSDNTTEGLRCSFTLHPPVGFSLRFILRYLDLGENDTFTIVSGDSGGKFPHDSSFVAKNVGEQSGFDFEQSDLIFNFSGPRGGGNFSGLGGGGATMYSKRFFYPVSIMLRTHANNSARGFLLSYEFVPRSDFLRRRADSSQLQFALSLLEMQGADLRGFNWDEQTARFVGDLPPGSAILGKMSDAENCFVCCSGLKTELEQNVKSANVERQQNLQDGAPLPRSWQIALKWKSMGESSTLARNFKPYVSLEDIPPLVKYMGYKPEHFFRTNFVSYLPPLSIKAPLGKTFGKRTEYRETGVADPSFDPMLKLRPEIGWGMVRLPLEDSLSWQTLLRSDLINSTDLQRFEFDLDHPDVALFSFVDEDRRIVIANEMAPAIPCGLLINNTCGDSCQVLGTALNRLQCMTNQIKTQCNEPVVDECNNVCGLEGTAHCNESLTAFGAVTVRSVGHDSTSWKTSSFQMTVGIPRDNNLTRSKDISGLGVDGATGIKAEWGHPSISESSSDEVDNALYFSYDDAAQELKGVTSFDIFGIKEDLKLSSEEFRVMVSGALKLDMPIECNVNDRGRDACKTVDPQDSVSNSFNSGSNSWAMEWYNPENAKKFAPRWDSNFDKRMSQEELITVIQENLVFFSIAQIQTLRACRRPEGAQQPKCPYNLVWVTAQKMLLQYGRKERDGGHCGQSVYDCYMAVDDILRLVAEHEGFRRSFKQTLFHQNRFQLAKIQRMGTSVGGFEIGSPDPTIERAYNHNTNTLRISTYFESTAEYIRLGSSRYLNYTKTTYMQAVKCVRNESGQGLNPYGDGVLQLQSGWIKAVQYYLETCNGLAELCFVFDGICNITLVEWAVRLDVRTLSHVFIDGVIDKPDPLVFRPSNIHPTTRTTKLKVENKRRFVFGRPNIEIPTVDPANLHSAVGERPITLPDASGIIVTSGNLAALKRIPGLRKRSSFTPHRYNAPNGSILQLDDSKQILGGAYHYKKMQGNQPFGCGRFKDGTSIPCDPLKTLYDALEDQASSSDDIFIYAGTTELQGPFLTNRVPATATAARLNCSRYSKLCENPFPFKEQSGTKLYFIPKTIPVCYKYQNKTGVPCRCKWTADYGQLPSGKTPEEQMSDGDCPFGGIPSRCQQQCFECDKASYSYCDQQASVFGGPGKGWNDFNSFEALSRLRKGADVLGEPSFKPGYEDWVFPFDTNEPIDSDICSFDLARSANFTFLHIYYGTEIGVRAWQTMGKYLNTTRPGRAFPDSFPIQYAALKYLHMQGIARIEWDEAGAINKDGIVDNIGRLDLMDLWEKEWNPENPDIRYPISKYTISNTLIRSFFDKIPQNSEKGIGMTDTEQCVACCGFYPELTTRIYKVEDGVRETPCNYINVSGFDEAEAIGGLYSLIKDQSSFGSPAWKQTPGDYFLHFLPLACTSRPQCGTSVLDVPDLEGPAWVIGPQLGVDSIMAFAKLDCANVSANVSNARDRCSPNVTIQEKDRRRREAYYDPSSAYLNWYEPTLPANNMSYRGFWKEIEGKSYKSRLPGKGLTVACFDKPVWQVATTSMRFADATEYSKLSFPDASGTLISSGNLHMLTSLGTQVSPIIGRHTRDTENTHDNTSAATRLHFGIGWQTVNITNASDNVDFEYTTRNLSYCPIPKDFCKYTTNNGLFSCKSDKEFQTIPIKALDNCEIESGYPIPGTDYGVDALVMSYDQSADCVALFEIDEYLDAKGSFQELQGKRCLPGSGNSSIVLVVPDLADCPGPPTPGTSNYFDRCKPVAGTPELPGIFQPQILTGKLNTLCPTFTSVLNGMINFYDEDCKIRLRFACQQACLRERGCVAAMPFLKGGPEPNIRCHLIMDSCEQQDVPRDASFETWLKSSGGWQRSRLNRSNVTFNLSVGSKVVLDELSFQSFTVKDIKEQTIQITWNQTSSRHFRLCPAGLVTSGMISDPFSGFSRNVTSDCQRDQSNTVALGTESTCRVVCPAESPWASKDKTLEQAHVVTSRTGKSCCELCGEFTGLPAIRAWRLAVERRNLDCSFIPKSDDDGAPGSDPYTLIDILSQVGDPGVDRLVCTCGVINSVDPPTSEGVKSPLEMVVCTPPGNHPMFSNPTLTYRNSFSDVKRVELVDVLDLKSFKGNKTIRVENVASLAPTKRIRIGQDVFKVLRVSISSSQMTIEPMRLWGLQQAYLPGNLSRITEIIGGGFLNVSSRDSLKIAHGVYSLENITLTLNTKLANTLHSKQFAVSFNIVEPQMGLCGETIHGATRNLRSFHCAPASRYIELTGGIKPNTYVSDDDVIHIMSSSRILETLGIHKPLRAYTFGQASLRNLPDVVKQHPVLPGAGYVSSGYGTQSGYGLGGQAGWTNYVPPEFHDRVVHLTWCHDYYGPGFQCLPSNCSCDEPVVTYARILGATRTQRGQEPSNNIIHLPSSADGIVLSSGNLEDVQVKSGHVTGLRIDALLENDKNVAMRIKGRLEFASCNTVFGGEKDCSLINTNLARADDISISLDSKSSIAFHLWESQIVCIAIKGASDGLTQAAVNADSNQIWRRLPFEKDKVNKTFSALQDEVSISMLMPVCKKYCKALMEIENRESAAAVSDVADLLAVISDRVAPLVRLDNYNNNIELCEAVSSYENVIYAGILNPNRKIKSTFNVSKYGKTAFDECKKSISWNQNCMCSHFVLANAVCNVPHEVPLNAELGFTSSPLRPSCSEFNKVGKPQECLGYLWEKWINASDNKTRVIDESIAGYDKCYDYIFVTDSAVMEVRSTSLSAVCVSEGAKCKFPDNMGHWCCSIMYALGSKKDDILWSRILQRFPDADMSTTPVDLAHPIPWPLMTKTRSHALQQVLEAESPCVCAEIEGLSSSVKGGYMDVKRRLCDKTAAISDDMLVRMGDANKYQIPSGVCTSDGSYLSLGFNGSESKTIFNFDHNHDSNFPKDGYLMIPHTNGVILTTGNLDAVTKEAGSMTSLHVTGMTEIADFMYIGLGNPVGFPAASQGSRKNIPLHPRKEAHCQGTDISGTDKFCVIPQHTMTLMNTSISIQGAVEKSNLSFSQAVGEWRVSFPTWDEDLCAGHVSSSCVPRNDSQIAAFVGRVITTGNLQDIEELSPHYVDASGSVDVQGPVELGSGYSCNLPGRKIRGILSKEKLPNYPYAVWSTFTASQCVEMQSSVDWKGAPNLSADACKVKCQKQSTCGAILIKKGIDRSLQSTDERCILLNTFASGCTVRSYPGQDLHLLVREAPSPWFNFDGDDSFFESICRNSRSNITHVPGTPIRFHNFVAGDIVYRESDPHKWAKYVNQSCDTFGGFKWGDAKNQEIRKELVRIIMTANEVKFVDIMTAKEVKLIDDKKFTRTLFTGFLSFECLDICKALPGCSVVTVSHFNRTCAFSRAVESRRTLATLETLTGNCARVSNNDADIYIWKDEQQTKLYFEAPTANQTISFPDASGVIITTGNLYDIQGGIGLIGSNIFTSKSAIRDKGLMQYDRSDGYNSESSMFSGKEKNLIVRGCNSFEGCSVYSSRNAYNDQDLEKKLNAYVPANKGTLFMNPKLGALGSRGLGSGFDFFETFVDASPAGSRTSGECTGSCKGDFPCERGKSTCFPSCDGYMFPRPGIHSSESKCNKVGASGKICGCANGKPYGDFGTKVCVMQNKSHPDHGRYCSNTTEDGSQFKLWECCQNPVDNNNCGKCVEFAPVVPLGLNQRLTFPQANGTVITTGNVDDIKLSKVKIETLRLQAFLDLGTQFPGGQSEEPTYGTNANETGYRYKPEYDIWAANAFFDPLTSRISTEIRLVEGYGHPNTTHMDLRPKSTTYRSSTTGTARIGKLDPYTSLYVEPPTQFPAETALTSLPQYQQRYCMESEPYRPNYLSEDMMLQKEKEERTDPVRCRKKREILIPDVSGTILTTGNLHQVTSMAIGQEDLVLADTQSSLKVSGNTTLGRRVSYTHDPFNHLYIHGPDEIAFLDKQFQSTVKAFARVDGDIGVSFQTAGEQIPLIGFAPVSTERKTSHPWKIKNYGNFFGPFPFGGDSPTEEVSRFAMYGRQGDNRNELWNEDRIKLNHPLGSGVDKALRYFFRNGAPSIPVIVQDHVAAISDTDALRNNFGYKSGRPVLHMRTMTSPGDVNFYNVPLNGTHPINESWCYRSIKDLALQDASLHSSQSTTMSTFTRHLTASGFIKQTQMRGDFFGSPSFGGDLTSNRVNYQTCEKFAWDTVQKVRGSSEINIEVEPSILISVDYKSEVGLLARDLVHERFRVYLYQSKSDLTYDSDPTCGLIKYNSTFQDVRMLKLSSGKGCKESQGSEELKNVNDVEECFQKCMTLDSGTCSGFTLQTLKYHKDRNLAGNCKFVTKLDSKKCTLTDNAEDAGIVVNSVAQVDYVAYNATLLVKTSKLVSRDCRSGADHDFSTPEFDSYRSQYGLADGNGLSSDLKVNLSTREAFLFPSLDKEKCFVCCVLNTSTSDLVANAFDNDPNTFHSYFMKNAETRALVALDLGPGSSSVITSIRFFPRPKYESSMVGGIFQGSNVDESLGYEDLYVVEYEPAALEYTTVKLSNPKPFRWLRYVGPNGTFGDVSEIEFHRGYMVEELSKLQSGNVSWNVDEKELQKGEHVKMAMLVKCVAQGFLPAFLTSSMQEILVPHSQGIIITTGNLEEINKETRSFSSINVAENALIGGSVELGNLDVDTMLEVNAVVQRLAFRGPLIDSKSLLSFQLSPNPLDATFSLPDHSGTLVIGDLPSVMSKMNVLASGGIDFDWSVHFEDNVNFGGDSQGAPSLDILAVLGNVFPLVFGGTFQGHRKVSIGSPQASKESVVTFPDATGTILTTGSIPKSFGTTRLIDHTIMQGIVTFKDVDVEIGDDVGLHLNANIMGFTSLTFDGSTRKDGKTLMLSAADPESNNEITLPDTSGTVITTANFPTSFESLRTLGHLEVMGNTIAEVDLIRIGGLKKMSHVELKAHITGKFPLAFDGGTLIDNQSITRSLTTLQVPETSRHNIITFPDISGTVITSTTLPSRVVTIGTYKIVATEVLVACTQTSMGLSSTLSGYDGSFHFADTFARERGNRPERENQFMVHALGGVNIFTGRTTRGTKTGAILRPGSSAWYYVSDKDAKTVFQEVNASAIVESLGQTPVYRWRYSGNHSGHLHVGPMAQDMYQAFSLGEHSDRISTIDADGVSLASIKGIYKEIAHLNATAAYYRKHFESQESTISEQRLKLKNQDQVIHHLSVRIKRLWKMISNQILTSHNTI